MHISNWSASRAGAGLTVRGTADIDGSRVLIGSIKKIETRGRIIVAIAADGAEHILRVGDA